MECVWCMQATAKPLAGVTDLRLAPGTPEPLGPSAGEAGGAAGVNFALFAGDATGVTLVVSDADDAHAAEFVLDPAQHRTGGHWHAFLAGLPRSGVLYGFRVAGEGGWETGHRCG